MNRDFYRLKNTLMFSFLWTNNFLLTWEVYNIIIKLLIRFNLYCLYSFKYCRINIPYLSIYLNSVGGNMFSICLIALHKKWSFPLRISSLMENLIFCTVYSAILSLHVFFFHKLFGCFKANHGLLTRKQLHSSDVNHCTFSNSSLGSPDASS